MELTNNVAVAMGKAFAVFVVELDKQSGHKQNPENVDCVAVEESDMYPAFLAEFWPKSERQATDEFWEMLDKHAGYQLFRKTLYEHAAELLREAQSDDMVMTPEEAHQLLTDMFPDEAADQEADNIGVYVYGPDNPADYFSKIANVDELRLDFKQFLEEGK